jgi:hypothetical protein
MGNTQQATGQRRDAGGTWGRRWRRPLEFIDTNNCQPNIMRVCGPVEACCVFIETQEPGALKRHGSGPCLQLRWWCDLMAWGAGFPELGGPMWTT